MPVIMGNMDADQRRGMQQFARNFGDSTQSLESLVAISQFEDGEFKEVRLYPTELGIDSLDSRLGIPRMASLQQAQQILQRVERLSDQWGTTIDFEGSVGIIHVR